MKAQAGAVAQQQALVLVFGLSYRKAAEIARVHHRNLWSHVAAKPGSKVASWDSRPLEIKHAAIKAAFGMLFDASNCCYNAVDDKARYEFRKELLYRYRSSVVSDYLDFLHYSAQDFVDIEDFLAHQNE